MLLQRTGVICAASLLLLLQTATPARALSDANVCSFTTANLYVRDASQTAFPPGLLSCVGADSQLIARCASCKCRDKQSGSTGGKTVEWGLCIEGTEACVTSQTPDREFCGNDTESGTSFRPGTVTGANTDNTDTSSVSKNADGVEELASKNGISNGSSKSSSASAYVVGGCAVAGVAAIAMFAVARKQKNESRELGTPMQDSGTGATGGSYDHNNTSKANTLSDSTISFKNRLSERMSGESVLDDDSYRSNKPLPPPPANGRFINQQQKQQQQQQQRFESQTNNLYGAPPSYAVATAKQQQQQPTTTTRPDGDSMIRDSSFFGSEFDERFTIEDDSTPQRSGFESIAYGKGNNVNPNANKPDFDSSFMSVTASGFDSSFASVNDFEASHGDLSASPTRLGDSMYDSRNTSLSIESDGLTMFDRDTAASEFLRESADSVVFSASSSSLSFYEDEVSPRKSIEF